MNPNNHLLATTGTQMTELSYLLTALETLISEDGFGNDKSRAEVRTQVALLKASIDKDFIKPIEKKLPSVLFMPPAELDRAADEVRKIREQSLASDEPVAESLEFADQFSAVLIRQTMLNIITSLNRSCAIYEKQKNCSVASKRLFRQRMGQLLGEGIRDILVDLFTEQPELAVGTWKQEFDWVEIKKKRDEAKAPTT